MQIDQIVETPDGAVSFKGQLSPEETKMVMEIGLNFLVRSGAFNLQAIKKQAVASPEIQQ